MNKQKMILALATMMILLFSMMGIAGAAATISPSTETPIVGEEITFTVGTTLEGLEATISTTGLTYLSNTGLGNTTHAITVPGVGTAYTYRVSAQEGETVSFVLSDVQEADDQGNEVEGQRVTWMGTAQRAAAPTDAPTQTPSTEPSPSEQPSASQTAPPSGDPQQPTESTVPTTSGNPSPTINPSQNPGGTSAGGAVTGGTTGGNAGGTGNTGGTSGGTAAGTQQGTSQGTTQGGANPPKTGDISHFWIWVGIGAVLTLIVIAAGKRVFAD